MRDLSDRAVPLTRLLPCCTPDTSEAAWNDPGYYTMVRNPTYTTNYAAAVLSDLDSGDAKENCKRTTDLLIK